MQHDWPDIRTHASGFGWLTRVKCRSPQLVCHFSIWILSMHSPFRDATKLPCAASFVSGPSPGEEARGGATWKAKSVWNQCKTGDGELSFNLTLYLEVSVLTQHWLEVCIRTRCVAILDEAFQIFHGWNAATSTARICYTVPPWERSAVDSEMHRKHFTAQSAVGSRRCGMGGF